jgi:hypothetical protein
VRPRDRRGYPAFDVPLVRHGERELMGDALPLGTPILESAPRLSGTRRFLESAGARRACAEVVARGGGELFFERPGWEATLRRTWEGSAGPAGGELEPDPVRAAACREELLESKHQIEDRLGRAVHHVCFPWHASSAATEELATEVGYRTAWCGKLAGIPLSAPGSDPARIARVGEDFFERLPGAGRVSLAGVLRGKLGRRLRSTS